MILRQHANTAGRRRSGLTLLEVVLALTILAGSFAMLSQLVGVALRAASNGRDLTRAQLVAESVMSEIAAGIMPAQSIGGTQVPSDPDWIVSAIVESTPYQGIVAVTVLAEKDTNAIRRPQYALTRWLRDPSLEIPEDPVAAAAAASTAAPSSASGTGAGGTGAGGAGAGGAGAGGTGAGGTGAGGTPTGGGGR